jgi:Skp family chaperone for outer membrane proteins
MRCIRGIFACAVVAFTLALVSGAGGLARAQDKNPPKPAAAAMPTPVVAVIDFQLVVKESAAGKSVRSQIDERQSEFQAEIKPLQQELESVRAELGNRIAGIGEAEYATKRKAIRERVNELQRIIQERKRQLDEMFNNGMRQVDLALVDVLKELAEERGINLILNAGRGRGLVLFAENQIVITEEALRRLDARLPKVELTKPEAGK